MQDAGLSSPDENVEELFRPLLPEQVALLELSPNPKLVLDRAFRVRFVNAAAAAYGNVDRDSLIGLNIWECYPTLRGTIVHEAYQRVLDTGLPARFERHDSDLNAWQSVYAYPSDGGVIAVLEDVTLQRRTTDRLRRSEETLRLAQEAANIGSFELNVRTGAWQWSDQLVRMMGLDPETFDQERIGQDVSLRFSHEEDGPILVAALDRVVETREKASLRVRVRRVNGEERHMLISAILVHDADTGYDRLIGTALDITEQVRADEHRARIDAQMQQAQKLESLGVLAGGIAHDFNNLLVGILGNASLALLELDAPNPVRESLHEIERAAQKAAELTRQLLAYAGKGRYLVEPVDPSAMIGDMASLLRSAVSRTAALQFELPSSLPAIEVDANQFRQVVMTLVTNASDALGAKPGVISVLTGRQDVSAEYFGACVPGTVATPGPYVFVEVRDTGSGMNASTRQRMFEPFFSTKFTGRGLGLAATIGIMRSHGGAIRVYSEVGSGTSVKLLFPAQAAPAVHSQSDSGDDDAWKAAGHILVVDDEESVRSVASALLRRRGFTVSEARDGLDAVSVFSSAPSQYALVLLDLTMPNMNGEETLRALRHIRPDISVLLMSGYNEQDVARMFAGRELSGFLQKPFSAGELYEAVGDAVGRG